MHRHITSLVEPIEAGGFNLDGVTVTQFWDYLGGSGGHAGAVGRIRKEALWPDGIVLTEQYGLYPSQVSRRTDTFGTVRLEISANIVGPEGARDFPDPIITLEITDSGTGIRVEPEYLLPQVEPFYRLLHSAIIRDYGKYYRGDPARTSQHQLIPVGGGPGGRAHYSIEKQDTMVRKWLEVKKQGGTFQWEFIEQYPGLTAPTFKSYITAYNKRHRTEWIMGE